MNLSASQLGLRRQQARIQDLAGPDIAAHGGHGCVFMHTLELGTRPVLGRPEHLRWGCADLESASTAWLRRIQDLAGPDVAWSCPRQPRVRPWYLCWERMLSHHCQLCHLPRGRQLSAAVQPALKFGRLTKVVKQGAGASVLRGVPRRQL